MLSSCGRQCVLVFFILSGFVIHHSFINSNKNLKHFYIIRLLRIYIPYIFSVLFSILTLLVIVRLNSTIAVDGIREYNSRLLISINDLNINSVMKSLLFLKSKEYPGCNFAYWSLLHEGIFYLFYPIYYYLGSRYKILLFIFLIFSYIIFESEIFYYQLYFLIGIYLYGYYQSGKKFIPFIKGYFIVSLFMFTVGFILTNILSKYSPHYYADLSGLFTIIIVFDYIINNGIQKNKYLSKLSDISYTLYLNHLSILMICYYFFYVLLDKYIFFERYPYYIGIITSVICSYLIYFFTEKQSLILINKIKSKWL